MKRFIDKFSVILLDMGNTFMFGCDKFGEDVDYCSAYRSLGGRQIDSDSVAHIINHLFEYMLEIGRHPAYYDDFGTIDAYLRALPEAAGLPPSELEMLERVFAWHEVGEVPDSHAAILRDLNLTHPLGVVSNIWSHHSIFEEEFKRAGIDNLFEIIIWSSDHGCIKPSPRIFHKALSHFKADPQHVLFVGDNLERDVGGAKAVGMETVWINHGERQDTSITPQPTLIISDLGELLNR